MVLPPSWYRKLFHRLVFLLFSLTRVKQKQQEQQKKKQSHILAQESDDRCNKSIDNSKTEVCENLKDLCHDNAHVQT